jgi:hypothetical protein
MSSFLLNESHELRTFVRKRSQTVKRIDTDSMAHLNTRVNIATKGGATHSYSDEEVRIACVHLNEIFGVDPELAFEYLPLSPDNHQEFFSKFQDGVLLWYVICFVSLVILVTDFISLFISH